MAEPVDQPSQEQRPEPVPVLGYWSSVGQQRMAAGEILIGLFVLVAALAVGTVGLMLFAYGCLIIFSGSIFDSLLTCATGWVLTIGWFWMAWVLLRVGWRRLRPSPAPTSEHPGRGERG